MSEYAHLVLQLLSSGLLCLLLVDELHQDPLVLKHVPLGLEVQLVIQMAVDLLGLPRGRKCHRDTKSYIFSG